MNTQNSQHKGRSIALIGGITIVLMMLGLIVLSANFIVGASAKNAAGLVYGQQSGNPQQPAMGGQPAGGGTTAVANLQHTPTGTANLTYNKAAQTLTVTVSLTGLAPKSQHPAHIHLGSCKQQVPGTVKFTLNTVFADAQGQASTTTVLHGVKDGIPAFGWYVNVHNGPGMATADEKLSISCSTVLNPHHATNVLTFMGPSPSINGQPNNELATGFVALKLVKQGNAMQLVATINIHGLVPQSIHAAHIHVGTCFSTGMMLYDLHPIQADSQGNVVKTVTIDNVKVNAIPATGWAINVHFSTQLGTQTGYNPILCGNVTPDQPAQ